MIPGSQRWFARIGSSADTHPDDRHLSGSSGPSFGAMGGLHEYSVSRLRRSSLLRFARALAVIWLCLSTPAVLDIIVETAGWLSGADCCADDCEETGAPCTQQCIHCVCGGHNLTLPFVECTRGTVADVTTPVGLHAQASERAGHLEPPFRPPVS